MEKTENTKEHPVKVAIFVDYNTSNFQNNINDWLSKNNITIIDIQTHSRKKEYPNDMLNVITFIFYKEHLFGRV